MRNYPRLVFERKRTGRQIVLEYGSTNPVEGSNLQPVAWCLDAWSLGADGVLPGKRSEPPNRGLRPTSCRCFIRRKRLQRAALPRVRTANPSIRLKAYRRGQQDVEYLTLWSQLHNEPRWAVGQQVRATLNLAGTRQGTGFTGGEDAGRSTTAGSARATSGPCESPLAKTYQKPIRLPRPSSSIFARRSAGLTD